MAHVPFRADIDEVSQGNAVRWNAAEEFYNNQGSNITLQHMSARHIIVFPSANLEVILPDTNTLLDGWQVHIGFPFSTSDNPYEITVKDAAGAEWRKLIKGQWCECVKKGGSWYVYPPGSVADTGTIVPGTPPPQPPTVPSGTVLQSFAPCVARNNNLGGFILSPVVTTTGYVRKFTAILTAPSTYTKVIARALIISGTTYIEQRRQEINNIVVSTNNCTTYTLTTPLQVNAGEYLQFLAKKTVSESYWSYWGLNYTATPKNTLGYTTNDATTGSITLNNTFYECCSPVIEA